MKIEAGMIQYPSDLMSSESVYKLARIFARDFRAVREGDCISNESYEILYNEFGCKRFRNQKRVNFSGWVWPPIFEDGYVGINIGLYWDTVLVPYDFAMKTLLFGGLPTFESVKRSY
jgi:hypothetical protein